MKDVDKYFKDIHLDIKSLKRLNLAIVYKGNVCGELKFHHFIWSKGVTEIGYWIGEEYQGKGIVSKSLKKLIDVLAKDMKIKTFEAVTDKNNVKSISTLKKLNFIKYSIHKGSELLNRHNNKGEYYKLDLS